MQHLETATPEEISTAHVQCYLHVAYKTWTPEEATPARTQCQLHVWNSDS